MKKLFNISFFLLPCFCMSQEVLRLSNGGIITVQNGAELTLQGGITLDNGSLLINNGTTWLKNNSVANQSFWKDNSFIGALGGSGLVVFNSGLSQQYWGPTHFFNVQLNNGGLILNNNFTVDNQLHLIKGKINTGANYAFLTNTNAASLINDAANAGYINSWINGNFRRSMSSNTSTYDFPVGGTTRCNLLQFLNNNVSGINYLTASFGPKPGNDGGLNVSENAVAYTAINNGGVWFLTPDVSPIGGNYALHLYLTGFTGLSDNQFGILRRPNASSNGADWQVPAGSLLESGNGAGRKVIDGFARRYNITDFSQWGIGMTGTPPCIDCPVACTYSQGFYGNINGSACYNNSGTIVSSSQLMVNAFGADAFKIFGNVANRRFFTLFKTDIVNQNIFKMLPGTGNSQPIAIDNILPLNGAYYDDPATWYLVPILSGGKQKGRINNLLLSQTIALWFNLRTDNILGAIDLSRDTLVTVAQTNCGSGILTGPATKFGIPHNVIVYLNGGNGYTNNVNGLFQLANDVLGGVNTSVSAAEVQNAVATINNAFDGCRVLIGTIAYLEPEFMTINSEKEKVINPVVINGQLSATAFPNPYKTKFSLLVKSPVTGTVTIQLFSVNGSKIYQFQKFVIANTNNIIPYPGPYHRGILVYKIKIDDYEASGTVIGPN